jgi:hypothetical protein
MKRKWDVDFFKGFFAALGPALALWVVLGYLGYLLVR